MTRGLDPAEAASYRQNLLRYPSEQSNVDYKAAMPFDNHRTDAFTAKIVKHIIAFANSGGGTLVIGFKENAAKQPEPDPAMSDIIASTYDVTPMTRAVNHCVRGTEAVTIEVHREYLDDPQVSYVVITVSPFIQAPFFCNVDMTEGETGRGRKILAQGDLYVRTGQAETVALAQPDDWIRLLNAAVEARQNDLLTRFSALMRQFGLTPNSALVRTSLANLKEEFESWISAQEEVAQETAADAGRPLHGSLTFSYRTVEALTGMIAPDLLRVAQAAIRPNTGWPIGVVLESPSEQSNRTVSTETGLVTIIGRDDTPHFDYWVLDYTGQFLLFRNLQEDWEEATAGKELKLKTAVWRIAEALDHCVALFRALGADNQAQIMFEARYSGLTGRILTNQPDMFMLQGPATVNTVKVFRTGTLDEFAADADGLTFEVARQVFSVFNFFDVNQRIVAQHYQEYRASKVR